MSSDDEIDIGRKLDKGNFLLATIIIDNKTGLNNLTEIMSDHNTRMDEHNTRLEAHNTRLEAILEKLANK